MEYKPLGKTGKEISVIGFGGMRFLSEEYQAGNYDKCAQIVLKAQELGINYFDTAPGYCHDKSESIYGHAFRQMKNKPYVSTKCGLWMTKDADGARRHIEKSLKTLGVEKLTFYNMWCIKHMDEYRTMTAKGGIYDGIVKAQSEGLVEHICCSTHLDGGGVAQIIADGKVEAVTLGYNALNFAYRRAGVKACHDAGVGVVVMNPLGGGVIPRHEKLFKFLSSSPDQTVTQAALRFLLGQREINVVLPGISAIAELEECIGAADGVVPVSESEMERLGKLLNKELNTLCTGCAYCDECPEDVPIPKLLDSYNEYLLGGGDAAVLERLQMHWSISASEAAKCTACGRCESLCTQKLPIIERLERLAKL